MGLRPVGSWRSGLPLRVTLLKMLGLMLPDLPNVWTVGSLVREEVSGCCSGGAGVYAHVSGSAGLHRSWGH